MASMDKQVEQILTLLRNRIRQSGYTQIEVQRKLHWGRSYLSQLLNGKKALRVEQVLRILEVIGIPARDFYADLYQFPRPEARIRNLDEYAQATVPGLGRFTEVLGGDSKEEDPAENLHNFRELRAMVRAIVQLLVEKEIVSMEDFAERARAADPGLRRRA